MNKILDYEQVLDELNKITSFNVIKEEEDLATTEYGLPIKYYTCGSGNLDIVITGATHGQEIITTDFVINLMKDISINLDKWQSVLKEFKIHFIPMLNPEGYLITTSAIRKKIPRNMRDEESQKICGEYYKIFKQDALDKENKGLKRHQLFFEGVDYTCIDDKYSKLKEHIKRIFEKYPDLPKWCLHTWSSNGNGIDIQANSKFNPAINRIYNNENVFMNSNSLNNIDISHPGPINCPFDKEKGFAEEKETKAISDLLERLDKENRLFVYLNYHSAGSMIFQRPANVPEGLSVFEDLSKKEMINYMFAKLYSSRTYKNNGVDENGNDRKNQTRYRIIKSKYNATSTNDIFRLLYNQDILIELSALGGNPLSAYYNIDNLYNNLIESNLEAVRHSLSICSISKMLSEYLYYKMNELGESFDYESATEVLDLIYQEFDSKVVKLEKDRKYLL